MKIFVGVTDNEWFDFLSNLQDIDEVNFWRPSADSSISISPGELFLFKPHSPKDFIVGGGVFVYSTILPVSLAWDVFGEKNGAPSFEVLKKQIIKYWRIQSNYHEDFKIGCILLTQPFFFDEADWFRPPDWKTPIVRGKTYSLETEAGKLIKRRIEHIWAKKKIFELDKKSGAIIAEQARYGKETLIKPRLGQGAFKVLVTDAYNRTCAITNERALPVLEAAHIKPYSAHGPHEINNGILLRSDMHRLFDKGYMTITPQLNIEISRRIKEEYDNGKYYFAFHGQQINLPQTRIDHPSGEFLTWHNEKVFRE